MKSNRGTIKLKKGIVGNFHPILSFLDDEDVQFQGWYDLDYKFFYIEYGPIINDKFKWATLTSSVENVARDIKEWWEKEKNA